MLSAARHRVDRRRGRVEQRDEPTLGDFSDEVRADQRCGDCVVLVGDRRAGVAFGEADAQQSVVGLGTQRQFTTEIAAGAHQPPAVDDLDVGAPGDRDRKCLQRRQLGGVERPERQLAFHRLVPTEPRSRPGDEFVDRYEIAAALVTFGCSALQLQEPHHDSQRGIRFRVENQLSRHGVVLADAALGCPVGTEDAELPARLVLPRVGPIWVEQVALV